MTATIPERAPAFEELAARVDAAAAAVAELDGPARAAAEELQAAVEAVHKAGLVTIVRALKADDAARAVLFALVDDPTVHLLLSLHGIVRPDPATLAERALAGVRPQLRSHGGDVSLDRIEDGVAYVVLEGACNGCSMSSATLRTLVEEALVADVPGVTAVRTVDRGPTPTLIPLDGLFPEKAATATDPAPGWADAGAADALADGTLTPMALAAPSGERADVIVVNVGQRLAAYRNECAHQALPLDDALLDVTAGTLTCPWHGFCFDAASGECLSAPGAQLEPLPLRVDGGRVRVRVA